MIPVTKAYLPSKQTYQNYVDQIFDSGWLTNNGQLVQQLEKRLADYLDVKHLICVANGTLALQVAFKALKLKGEVITSPFSFPATSSSLIWEDLQPIYADIDPHSFNLNPNEIAPHLSPNTSAILPVHVFGNPCQVAAIQEIANKHNLKVIYDAAHAFNVKLDGQSVLNFGDISTISFHSTKLFHTIEGGAIITDNDQLAKQIRLLINFGISGLYQVDAVGINAKMNEFEAAMGLAILDDIDKIHTKRTQIWHNYQQHLTGRLQFQTRQSNSTQNHAYAPVLFESETQLLAAVDKLNANNIHPRRYFYPSLDTIECFEALNNCPVSQDISKRILCLPIYHDLSETEQMQIIEILQHSLTTPSEVE